MKELPAIIRALADRRDGKMALATVVRTVGSSYRRPGARMLVLPDGGTVGSISGGCLERDVISHALRVREDGKAVLLTYDTTSEEDVVFGVGLGCKGVLEILVESVGHGNKSVNLIAFVESIFRRRQAGAVATIIRVEGKAKTQICERLMLDEDGAISSDVRDDVLKTKLLAAAREILPTGRCTNLSCELAGGVAEAFLEVIHSPTPLVVCGAGYDAVPLVRLAREVGFEVTVADGRPAYATSARFPEADAVVVARPEDDLRKKLGLNERTTAVIMSHHFLTDRA